MNMFKLYILDSFEYSADTPQGPREMNEDFASPRDGNSLGHLNKRGEETGSRQVEGDRGGGLGLILREVCINLLKLSPFKFACSFG